MSPFTRISVLVPTRRRIESLGKLLRSYASTVGSGGAAELVFRCDSDDADTIACLRQTPHRFIVGPRREGYKSLPVFFNEMAAIAEGDVLMCANDDIEFRTPGWPALVLDEANKYRDGIFNIGVTVGLNDDRFPFSIVSRRLVDAMGCLNDPRLLYSDVFLLDVARAFQRAVRLESVSVFHDWAGHRDDETRRDANHHEFDMVFADATGRWTETYRARHDEVVADRVRAIRRSDRVMPEVIVGLLEAYRPPETADHPFWPPRVACRGWNGLGAPNAMHYSKAEITEVIRAIYRHGVSGGDILLSSFNNGLPSILWSHLFDRVLTVVPCATSDSPPQSHGAHTLFFGSNGDTAFLTSVADRIGSLRAIVLDDHRYANLVSPYFFMRPLLKRPAMVLFASTGATQEPGLGACRFVGDLRTGFLDNLTHEIVDVHLDPSGPGMSYELLL
jgi:hypothetical protein